uniref:RRM domain-containing protein n=1 Tax=Caenorhabditis tropicalis TaxID=1561998 RepID=A0A1I7UCY1_9PELO
MSDIEMGSGSDDSEIEDLDEKIQEIKMKLSENKSSIPLANQLLTALRKNGDFDELNDKRKEFVQWAPLNPLNWKHWIEDIQKRKPEPSVEEVEKLFERAVFDENDVTIWFCRKTCEKALTAIGNRYDSGGHIWLLYLQYEMRQLTKSRNMPDFEKLAEQVAHLFQRALRVPTDQLEEVFCLAEQFCADFNMASQIDEFRKHYNSSMKQKEQLSKFQTLIDDPETKREGLKQYFDFEMKSGVPSRAQMAHERMVSELEDDESVWSAYGAWTDTELKWPQVSVEVYERALRHCPYSFVLHQQILLALERARKPNEVIDQLWERAKNNVIDSADEGRSLYRTYAFLLRRRIVLSGSNDYSQMAEIFDEGAAKLKEWFSMAWDPTAEYRQMQAYFYASLMHDMEKCRKIWNDILASGFGRFAGKWLDAVRLERQFGDNENARKFLSKALNSVSDNVNEIYVYYVQFEREEGTLAELDQVLAKVNSQIAHRASRPQKKIPEKVIPAKKEVKENQKRNSGGEPIVKKVKSEDGGFKAPLPPSILKKSSPSSGSTSTPSTVSFATSKASPGTEDARTIFVSNLDFTTTEDDIRQAIEGVSSIRFARKAHTDQTHRGFAYVVMENEEKTEAALQKDRVPVKGRPMFISANDPEKRVGFKFATGLEKSKIFVRNVHFQATEDELRNLFSKFGMVTSVRRVTHRDGKPKGVAFIDFDSEASAQKAVASGDKLMLRDRELEVAISNPPAKKEKHGKSGFVHKEATEEDGPRKGHAAKIQLVPRALSNKAPQITARLDAMDVSEAPSSSASSSETKPAQSLSNDEFRKMFMRK